jgi:hypothetical protein
MHFCPTMVAVVLVLALPLAAFSAEIKGKVTSAVRGEALGQIEVSVLELKIETTTAPDGTFTLQNLPPGNYVLRLNAVGFRLVTIPFVLATTDDTKEFSLVMVPDNLRRTDVVDVKADVFQSGDSLAVVEENLTSSEIRQASTVLADDPFRAIQSLPGVSAAGNNELLADFTVMGAPFREVGIYLDGVLIPSPFHNAPNVINGASLSLLTSEIVEDVKLLPVAYPEEYGDQVGAALDIHTREGSRTRPLFRAAVGVGDSDVLGEGRLGTGKRGSWLGSVRKSYLGYLTRNLIRSNFADISFYDGSLKLSYDLTPSHTLTFYGLDGNTHVDDSTATQPGDVRTATSAFAFLRTGWRWSITPHLLLDHRLAYIRQRSTQHNPDGQLLTRDSYGEWAAGSNLAWAWSRTSTLAGGWTLRRLADYFSSYFGGTPTVTVSTSDQVALRGSGYLQESSGFFGERLHVMGSARMDGQQYLDVHPFSAQAAVAWRLARATQLQFAAGRYSQLGFPDYQGPPGPCAVVEKSYWKSNHYSAGVEQRLGENTQVRLQLFDRQSGRFLQASGGLQCPIPFPQGRSQLARYYSRGVQIVLQRRSANRLSGWVGYTFARARESDALGALQIPWSPYFDNQTDQPVSLNAFATYRLKPTVNLSAKFLYGSGFPTRSGLTLTSSGGLQPDDRLPAYLRADFRADKCWAFRRWKMTLYGEVLNLTNHDNQIFSSLQTQPNGQIILHTQRALPITPTAGVAFEF